MPGPTPAMMAGGEGGEVDILGVGVWVVGLGEGRWWDRRERRRAGRMDGDGRRGGAGFL